ncbi:YcnI family protein [Nocardioides sp. AE5]|uniref:YcnI family copper-binding membrane protein n=1 Tax=Nocardioides sp. AE5 TaxID=2962573 RepID=UPI0028824AED|nr:YcnI family protein [Nocardioides sp. AE5]MDT0201636.1 YcnI family protein [Nocardioides sp. AE5]
MNITRTLVRLAVVPVLGASLLIGAGSAQAHVTVSASTTAAGSSSLLTFAYGHGCDGSPTTRVAIKIPEQVVSVTPTRSANYTVEKVMATLDEPITDAHGNEITERVDQVVYTATTPLPDGQRDELVLSVSLPDAEGETLVFPTIQTCEVGETAWTEVAADGQDSHDLAAPAPTVTLTAAEGDGYGHGDQSADAGHEAAGNDAASEDADGGSNELAIAGLVAGVLGLLAGGAALARSRK